MNIKKNSLILILIFLCSCFSNNSVKRIPANYNHLRYEFLGDIEGNYKKFLKYIGKSEGLYFKGNKLHIKKGSKFIFLGDAIDKGVGAMRILDTLNDLKRRYPKQYIQIAGNRDLNKMRIPNELSDEAMKKPPRNPRVKSKKENWKVYHDWLKSHPDNKVNRLKFILKTMAAHDTFEFRREEMAILEKINIHNIEDEAVLDSFLSDFSPNGRMANYIQNSQLLYLTDNGTLIAHGFVGETNFGYIPFSKNFSFFSPESKSELETWVNKVNWNTQRLINLWKKELSNKNLRSDSEWMDLVRFQEPRLNTNKNALSFIYGRYSDENGNPQLPHREFLKKAERADLKRIIVGHTPAGDYPVVLTDPITKFQIVLADTSFSKDDPPQIVINDDGLKIKGTLHGKNIITNEEPYIGFKTFNDFHVIGKHPNTNQYILHKIATINGQRFSSIYKEINLSQLKLELSPSKKLKCIRFLKSLLKSKG